MAPKKYIAAGTAYGNTSHQFKIIRVFKFRTASSKLVWIWNTAFGYVIGLGFCDKISYNNRVRGSENLARNPHKQSEMKITAYKVCEYFSAGITIRRVVCGKKVIIEKLYKLALWRVRSSWGLVKLILISFLTLNYNFHSAYTPGL